jgi:hypothetical protein
MDEYDLAEAQFVSLQKKFHQYKSLGDAFRSSLTTEERRLLNHYRNNGYYLINRILMQADNLTGPYHMSETVALDYISSTTKSMPQTQLASPNLPHSEYVRRLACSVMTELGTDIQIMDTMFDRAPRFPMPTILYRGIHSDFAKALKDAPLRKPIVMPGYTSTSIDPSISNNFAGSGANQTTCSSASDKLCACCMLALMVPKGMPFIYVDDSVDVLWENEILLPRGCSIIPLRHEVRRDISKKNFKTDRGIIIIHARIVGPPRHEGPPVLRPDLRAVEFTTTTKCGAAHA